MKKILFLALICTWFATSSSHAQNASKEAATTKGDVILDIGIGFIGGDYTGYHYNYGNSNTWNYNYSNNKIQLPTFSVSLQKAFWNDITIGGEAAFNIFGNEHDLHQNDGYYQHSQYTQSNLYIMARGEYHFNRLLRLKPRYDLYAGLLGGTRISFSSETEIYEGWGNGQSGSWRNDYPNRSSTDVGPAVGIFSGFRLYFAGNMAVFGEVGLGVTALRAGLAWRL